MQQLCSQAEHAEMHVLQASLGPMAAPEDGLGMADTPAAQVCVCARVAPAQGRAAGCHAHCMLTAIQLKSGSELPTRIRQSKPCSLTALHRHKMHCTAGSLCKLLAP